MFKRLQDKWKVSTRQFWIIFIVFGLTGTTTAIITARVNSLLGINESTWWLWKVLLKVGMLLIGYQVLLLFYGFLLGQWSFFWSYEKKLLQKLRLIKKDSDGLKKVPDTTQKKIAIFASGTGTNAANIIKHFKNHPEIRVELIVSNNLLAGVLDVGKSNQIEILTIDKTRFFSDGYIAELEAAEIHFIVLAGFLWKVPQVLINRYRNKIINIHPALLPKYGGKGMYGSAVHQAVLIAGETESGITIHYVDEHYDNGDIIFQAKCSILQGETLESLAKKIHELEYQHFPVVIERCITESAK